MNKIIVPTGYMGSGSSAITDLISEISGYDADHGTFEYVFLHCPNGVFDLEDKLLIGNNALRSDEALRSFRHTMKQLFDKKYWWVGNYKTHLCPEFMDYTDKYIDSLIQHRPDFYWYYQENADFEMIIKLIVKRIVKILSLGRIETKKPLVYDDMVISCVTPEEFYEKTRVYLKKLWNKLGIDNRNLILDQLLLPFNLHRAHKYFEENEAEIFVVERDPRDMFIINKYIWQKNGEPVPYPTDVHEFCKYYASLRKMEKQSSYSGVHRLHFEDLIYNYEDSVTKVYEILGVNHNDHIKKGQKFNPDRSIENTQLFLADPKFAEERKVIEEKLSEYLYPFQYERKPNCNKSF